MAEEAKGDAPAGEEQKAAAEGDEAENGEGQEEELKEDEAGYTVLGNNRPTQKTVFSMYSKLVGFLAAHLLICTQSHVSS